MSEERKPSAEQYMKDLGVERLTELRPEHIGRWVPVKEALPPERLGVLVTRNDLDAPEFAWLRYAAGDPYSPYFACSGFAGLEDRGRMPENKLVAVTHWYSPTAEGLPVVTAGLFSDVGLGRNYQLNETGWFDTSEYTSAAEDKARAERRTREREADGAIGIPFLGHATG